MGNIIGFILVVAVIVGGCWFLMKTSPANDFQYTIIFGRSFSNSGNHYTDSFIENGKCVEFLNYNKWQRKACGEYSIIRN